MIDHISMINKGDVENYLGMKIQRKEDSVELFPSIPPSPPQLDARRF